jgi:HK97 family phage prohead protease
VPDIKIASDAELRHAIRKLARADASQDAVRKQVIADAKTLDLRGLIPDNWAEDGKLRSTDGVWAGREQRETYNDLYSGLTTVLEELYDDGDHYYCWVWVQDLTTTDVIFSVDGDLYSAPYTVTDGGPITVGDRVKVRPVTNYVETGTRAAPKLLEWRKKKATELRGKGLERRVFHASGMELREADDGILHLTGYASVTETPYDVGFYEETIARGAFTRTLSEEPDVQLLINHTGLPLARTKSGTLRLEERERGLWVDADLDPEDPDVQSLQRKMKRGDIDQMSFAFQATDSDWSDDFTKRRIKTVSIHRGDVSVVNMGANPASTATVRSQDAVQALHGIGGEGIVAALVEWRDHTLQPIEQRADKTMSAGAMEAMSQLANALSVTDDEPLLASLMGVASPEEPAIVKPSEEVDEVVRAAALPDHTTRARQRLATLEAGRR